jgi:hypothetical protein
MENKRFENLWLILNHPTRNAIIMILLKKKRDQVILCLLLFLLTYGVASLAVKLYLDVKRYLLAN